MFRLRWMDHVPLRTVSTGSRSTTDATSPSMERSSIKSRFGLRPDRMGSISSGCRDHQTSHLGEGEFYLLPWRLCASSIGVWLILDNIVDTSTKPLIHLLPYLYTPRMTGHTCLKGAPPERSVIRPSSLSTRGTLQNSVIRRRASRQAQMPRSN